MASGQDVKLGQSDGKDISSAGYYIGASLVVGLTILMGCSGPNPRAAQESQLPQELEYSDVAAGSRAAEAEVDPDALGELFGNWLIVGSSCPGICAMSNEEADSWIGLTATLAEYEVVFGGHNCRDAAYESQQVSKLDFFKDARFDFEELGIAAKEVQELVVSCEGQEWIAPGSLFFVRDRETLIAPWNGVYFELKRAQSKED